jgi:hypothetical protein
VTERKTETQTHRQAGRRCQITVAFFACKPLWSKAGRKKGPNRKQPVSWTQLMIVSR